MSFAHLPALADNSAAMTDARISEGASLDDMLDACGLNWNIRRAQVAYRDQHGNAQTFEDRSVLFRDDTSKGLSVMSKERYKVTQPRDIVETHRQIAMRGGFVPYNAGEMQGGRKIFMLAKHESLGDSELKAHLLLATSCDGTLSTTGKFLSFRPACANVLQFASKQGDEIRVPHSRQFDPADMADQLMQIREGFTAFQEKVDKFAGAVVTERQAMDYFARLYGPDKSLSLDKELPDVETFTARQRNTITQLLDNYFKGPGSQLDSARGTVWGLVNAVTHYQDHQAPTRNGGRSHSATFGAGAKMKDNAMYMADALADRVRVPVLA